MKRAIITVIIIAAALGGIFYILNKNKAKNEAVTVEAAKTNAYVAVRIDTARFSSIDGSTSANGISNLNKKLLFRQKLLVVWLEYW